MESMFFENEDFMLPLDIVRLVDKQKDENGKITAVNVYLNGKESPVHIQDHDAFLFSYRLFCNSLYSSQEEDN